VDNANPIVPIEAARCLATSQRLLVLAGAGLSADAGVPTFRGDGGLWRTYNVGDLATPEGFARDPALVWDWYRDRRLEVASCEPHPGQRALALLQLHFPDAEVLVATTNEDDLLERAGVLDVVHLHGSLFDTACSAGCGWVERDGEDNSRSFGPCPRCGALVRPGSVWFGEPLPSAGLTRIADFHPDGCLVVGSSCTVEPVSGIPGELLQSGVPVVEVNLDETPLSSHATVSLRGAARDLLPPLVDLLTSAIVRDQRRRQV
jgi:NAD-dependent deacetylase